MEKRVIAQQRGKSRQRSSVEKVDIVEHNGKGSHSAAVWKKKS